MGSIRERVTSIIPITAREHHKDLLKQHQSILMKLKALGMEVEVPHRWVCGVVGAGGHVSQHKGDVHHELRWEQGGFPALP